MNNFKQTYMQWYNEYVNDGCLDEITQEIQEIKNIEEAKALLQSSLKEYEIKNYQQLEGIYSPELIAASIKAEELQKRGEPLTNLIEEYKAIFGKEKFEMIEDLLDNICPLVLDDDDDLYDGFDELPEYTEADTMITLSQTLFYESQNLNQIIEKIKELEYNDATYTGIKTTDFNNKLEYISYFIEKEATNNDSDEHYNATILVDSEIEDQNNTIIDYFKNKHNYRNNAQDDDTVTLTL